MGRLTVWSVALALSSGYFAQAQGISGSYPAFSPNTAVSAGGISQFSSTPILPTDLVGTYRLIPSSPLTGGTPYLQGYSVIPLSAFASAADLAASTTGFQTQINNFKDEVRGKLANGIALAGAMDMIRPAAGTSNRFGGQVTDYDGRAAAAFSYMHQSGAFDVGVAGGFASGAAMGKLAAGVSW